MCLYYGTIFTRRRASQKGNKTPKTQFVWRGELHRILTKRDRWGRGDWAEGLGCGGPTRFPAEGSGGMRGGSVQQIQAF